MKRLGSGRGRERRGEKRFGKVKKKVALTSQNQVKSRQRQAKGARISGECMCKGTQDGGTQHVEVMTGTHVNTQRTHSCSFLMREKPLSRKSVMSLVAGCKKLSLRLCLALTLLSFLLNPFFFLSGCTHSACRTPIPPSNFCTSQSNQLSHPRTFPFTVISKYQFQLVKLLGMPMTLYCRRGQIQDWYLNLRA